MKKFKIELKTNKIEVRIRFGYLKEISQLDFFIISFMWNTFEAGKDIYDEFVSFCGGTNSDLYNILNVESKTLLGNGIEKFSKLLKSEKIEQESLKTSYTNKMIEQKTTVKLNVEVYKPLDTPSNVFQFDNAFYKKNELQEVLVDYFLETEARKFGEVKVLEILQKTAGKGTAHPKGGKDAKSKDGQKQEFGGNDKSHPWGYTFDYDFATNELSFGSKKIEDGEFKNYILKKLTDEQKKIFHNYAPLDTESIEGMVLATAGYIDSLQKTVDVKRIEDNSTPGEILGIKFGQESIIYELFKYNGFFFVKEKTFPIEKLFDNPYFQDFISNRKVFKRMDNNIVYSFIEMNKKEMGKFIVGYINELTDVELLVKLITDNSIILDDSSNEFNNNIIDRLVKVDPVAFYKLTKKNPSYKEKIDSSRLRSIYMKVYKSKPDILSSDDLNEIKNENHDLTSIIDNIRNIDNVVKDAKNTLVELEKIPSTNADKITLNEDIKKINVIIHEKIDYSSLDSKTLIDIQTEKNYLNTSVSRLLDKYRDEVDEMFEESRDMNIEKDLIKDIIK